MTDRETGQMWEESAEVWSQLSRKGFNIYADGVNIPALFELLPDIIGMRGIDLGCGEGRITRMLRERCRLVVGVDISPTFLRFAAGAGPGGHFIQASGQALPFPNESLDFVVASMSLMDMPEPGVALREAARVLKPGAFLQFSITHPCFTTRLRRKLRDAEGREYAFAIGRYFEGEHSVETWLFSGAPPEAKVGLKPFRLPVFYRTLSEWLNLIAGAGLYIERALEPTASDEVVAREPRLADTRLVAYFLHLRCRKPGQSTAEIRS